jgi:RHH-type proline utilization regulon transcriptional repressor/proline dehydrogenase/delta 1-pyrroline-5-carboxylate dehydrogenase
LPALQASLDWPAVIEQASPWVQAVRDHPPPFWAMESLLQEYPISTSEGLALMRLAEALLRVPDADTAIALTADQLGSADFGAGDGHTPHAALARLASAVISLSRHCLPDAGQPAGLFNRLGARAVVVAALRAVQLLGRQFVLGQSISAAITQADAARKQQPGLRYSYDMLGEGARSAADAAHYLASYQEALCALAASSTDTPAHNDGISIKLSALHPRCEESQRTRVLAELVPRVWSLCQQAAAANINLTIDAEEAERLELSLDVFERLLDQVAQSCPQWQGFGLAIQAYQTRATELVTYLIQLARTRHVKLMCRLVKGAYWDAEIKHAQEQGVPGYPVFTHKHHTDISYLACARLLLAAPDAIFPQFATHNAGTIAAIVHMAQQAGAPFELQRLHGMGEGIYRELLKTPQLQCRVYAPVGAHRDLLAYLVRRLLENGANASFVHQLVDATVELPQLLASPLHLDVQSALPLPPAIYGSERANSVGLDLSVESMRAPLLAALAASTYKPVPWFKPEHLRAAHTAAAVAHPAWSQRPVAERAAILRTAALALEAQLPAFSALLVKEARKTWSDAVAEVREAVDYLRYYAGQAELCMHPQDMVCVTGEHNQLRLRSRGVWVAISPWNFPLAIFIGQVSAALVTGNAVLAKPAEQTPLVAQQAVELLHAAGVPQAVLQPLHGKGETVGAGLVALPDIAGVVFTGSTAVAKSIQRVLADKEGAIVPLIAETGGINAMLVDSTALPEQVSDAVMQSAFRSAGQRCSALRLLCVHTAIAEDVIAMVRGAAQELVTGDPADFATDLGPLIDRAAFESVQQAVQQLRATATDLLPVVEALQLGFQLPQMFEVTSIASATQEIFGPVLQVVRWDGDPLQVIAQINQLGFGLTLGIQTRIDSRAQLLAQHARVGNVYINRNMTGAVVGVQPFGGEGLSGTGPKAGGPHYLPRFCVEQTVTVNTTAAGGNVTLLTA